jgi:hypothetical protein
MPFRLAMRQHSQDEVQATLLPSEPLKREIVRVEKNLNTFGYFTPSSKRLRSPSKNVTLQVRSEDGRRIEAKATIYPAAELGLPTTADQDKYFAFQKIIERIRKRQGVITNPVRFSSGAMLEILGKTDGGKNYREIWEWLRRMTLTGIESEGVIYLAGRKKYARDLFHVFQRSVAVGEELEDGKVAEDNYVWLSDWQLDNLNNRHTLPIDYDLYRTLQLHIAKALVPLLQIWFYASRKDQRVEKKYSDLCSLLGLQKFKSPSRIKQQIAPSLDELQSKRLLCFWELVHTLDGSDYKLVLEAGPAFVSPADLRIEGADHPALSDARQNEIVEALTARGVRQDRARKLVLDLPDDQPVLDQIEWGDSEVARKERTSDPIANPPGFYLYLVRANVLVPPAFETTRKRRLREEARQQSAEAAALEAQRELELYEQKERYQAFLTEQTDAHIRSRITPAALDRLVRAQMKKIKDEYPQYRWPEQTLRDFASKKLRDEIAAELNLPSFKEFREQRAGFLF